jgi:hypothetical protein
MDYELETQDSIFDRDKGFFLTPQSPDCLWALPPLSIEYQGLSPQMQSCWFLKLTTHICAVLTSRMMELYLHSTHIFMA